MQVSLHEVSDDVDIDIIGPRFRLHDVQQPDDVVMLEKFCFNLKVLSNLISRTMRLASMRS